MSRPTTARFGIDPPIPGCLIQQPILQVVALDNKNPAKLAVFTHPSHLLHHQGDSADCGTHNCADSESPARWTSSSAVFIEVGRVFSPEDMFARQQRILCHRIVKCIPAYRCARRRWSYRLTLCDSPIQMSRCRTPVPSRSAEASSRPAIATTSTRLSTRRSVSRCTRPMNPVQKLPLIRLDFPLKR